MAVQKRRVVREWLAVLPFLLPGLALFLIFILWPLAQGMRVSFYNWSIMPGAEQEFVGLANYKRAFVDPVVYVAVKNTLLYTVITVPGQMALGLLGALLLNAAIPWRGLFRSLYYIPVLTPWIIVAAIFHYMFSDGPSPVNHLLVDVLHLAPKYVNWLNDATLAQVPINLLGIWKGVGWNMVIFLAGLQSIPPELYEAAAIDGASGRQAFWRITIPLLRPVVLYALVLLTIGGFNVFISVYLLTNGGPLNSTQTVLNYMYQQGFKFFDFGYGFALAVLMGIVIFILSAIQFRFVHNKTDV
ncbi:MAG TPA: sugar ABC transporter permease [Symbiobacteriaceae bacterium]|nr:sugar ABC transporter permease [Symbiobacteriaceae bacterium]